VLVVLNSRADSAADFANFAIVVSLYPVTIRISFNALLRSSAWPTALCKTPYMPWIAVEAIYHLAVLAIVVIKSFVRLPSLIIGISA
jgi:hypothetical protein